MEGLETRCPGQIPPALNYRTGNFGCRLPWGTMQD